MELKKIFTRLAAALAFATVAGATVAAPQAYDIDPYHTFTRFSYDHFGYSIQTHRFDLTAGKVVFDPVARTGSVEVAIDMKSVSTGSKIFDGHLHGEDHLSTEKYPTAKFNSTKVNFEGDHVRSVDGMLTIKGITKPVTFYVKRFVTKDHPMRKVPGLGVNASAIIKRSEFGAGKMVPAVSDEVHLEVSLEALAAKPVK